MIAEDAVILRQGLAQFLADRGHEVVGAVEKHVANIFAKLGLYPSDLDNRRVLAVRYLQA